MLDSHTQAWEGMGAKHRDANRSAFPPTLLEANWNTAFRFPYLRTDTFTFTVGHNFSCLQAIMKSLLRTRSVRGPEHVSCRLANPIWHYIK